MYPLVPPRPHTAHPTAHSPFSSSPPILTPLSARRHSFGPSQLECSDYIGAVTDACTSAPDTEGCDELYEGWCAAASAWEGRGNALAPDASSNSSLAHYCESSAAYAALPSPAPAASPSPAPAPTPSPSPDMHGGSSPAPAAAACVSDPTRPECATYVYPDASVAADVTSLCNMMPYMPGCIIRDACTVGGEMAGWGTAGGGAGVVGVPAD